MSNISFKGQRYSHLKKKTQNPSAESRRLQAGPGEDG